MVILPIRKEIFYLTMHTTYFIYGYMTLDLDNERTNILPPLHGLLHQTTDGIVHTTALLF